MILNDILFENVTIFYFSYGPSHKSFFHTVIEEYHQKLERNRTLQGKWNKYFVVFRIQDKNSFML